MESAPEAQRRWECLAVGARESGPGSNGVGGRPTRAARVLAHGPARPVKVRSRCFPALQLGRVCARTRERAHACMHAAHVVRVMIEKVKVLSIPRQDARRGANVDNAYVILALTDDDPCHPALGAGAVWCGGRCCMGRILF